MRPKFCDKRCNYCSINSGHILIYNKHKCNKRLYDYSGFTWALPEGNLEGYFSLVASFLDWAITASLTFWGASW